MLKLFIILLAVPLTPHLRADVVTRGANFQSHSSPQSSSPAPRVFVFTAEPKGETPTDVEQGRLDSVKGVREALGRKAGLTMVTSASDATVLVEVIEREKTDPGGGGFGGTSVTPQGEVLIR